MISIHQLFRFLKKILIILCLWVFCQFICMYMQHTCVSCLMKSEEGIGSPDIGFTDGCKPLYGYWESHPVLDRAASALSHLNNVSCSFFFISVLDRISCSPAWHWMQYVAEAFWSWTTNSPAYTFQMLGFLAYTTIPG